MTGQRCRNKRYNEAGFTGGGNMEYPVIIERENGTYRALIPAFPSLCAEGASTEEAVSKIQLAAKSYLSRVEIRSINLEVPNRLPGAGDWIKAAGIFANDDPLFRQYLDEIEAERKRQYEEINDEQGLTESE
ncbi:MAG: type II toxin-antitoxin system HicB family antitoxin [Blastocatellia bacterium]